MILRTTINNRIGKDINMSQTFEHIIDGPEDADAAGAADATTFLAYMAAWTVKLDEKDTT